MTKILTRKSRNRLEKYDYSQTNHYFVTICNNNRKEWLPQQYPYVGLDEYIIMPNHLHGILIINKRTGLDLSLQIKIKSLSSLIGALKTTSSKLIHQNGLSDFTWQRSFHDHIIRNDKSLNNIRRYIRNNPATWGNDEENISCIYFK